MAPIVDDPLTTTLLIVEAIIEEPRSSAELALLFNLSDRHLKRYIREARHLGVDLESVRTSTGYRWHCHNAPAIRERLKRWLELQQSRNLVQPTLPLRSVSNN